MLQQRALKLLRGPRYLVRELSFRFSVFSAQYISCTACNSLLQHSLPPANDSLPIDLDANANHRVLSNLQPG